VTLVVKGRAAASQGSSPACGTEKVVGDSTISGYTGAKPPNNLYIFGGPPGREISCVIPALYRPGALPSPPSPPKKPLFPLALSRWRPPQLLRRRRPPRRPPPLPPASTSSFSRRARETRPKNTNKTYGPKQREWRVSSPLSRTSDGRMSAAVALF
jgi:hypothetical protein